MVEFLYIQKVNVGVNILIDLTAVNVTYKFGMELNLLLHQSFSEVSIYNYNNQLRHIILKKRNNIHALFELILYHIFVLILINIYALLNLHLRFELLYLFYFVQLLFLNF